MPDFTFTAPSFFESDAVPSETLRGILHDAPGMADHLAKIEKFTVWLKTEMIKAGIVAKGPFVDESCWIIEAPSNPGFVCCLVSGPDGGSDNFNVLVAEYAGATGEVAVAVEAILRTASEIVNLKKRSE